MCCPVPYGAAIPITFTANAGVYDASATLWIVVAPYDLLLVDAADEDTEVRITAALETLGIPYSRWNTYVVGMEMVPVDTLMNYQTVLWAAGDQGTSSLNAGNQNVLSLFLDRGGSLLLSAENYLSPYGEYSFTSDYLHVGSYGTNITGSLVAGETEDPIGDGVTLAVDYPSGVGEYPYMVVPDPQAVTIFRTRGSNESVAIRYPADGSHRFRVVFFGVALEAFPETGEDPNNIQTVVDRALNWLHGPDILAPTPPSNPELSPNGTLSWDPSMDNIGVDHYDVYRSEVSYFSIGGMTPFTITTGATVLLPEGIGEPAINSTYRISAKDAVDNESSASPPVGEHEILLD